MKTKLTLLAAIFAATALALVANGCGKTCGPDTCGGCCDANNDCQTATNQNCGKNGSACTPCTGLQQCVAGACVAGSTNSSAGNTNGTNSSASNTTGSNTTGSNTTGSNTTGGSTGTTTTSSGPTSTSGTTGTTTTSSGPTSTSGTTGTTTTSSGPSSTTTGSTTTGSTTSSTTGGSFCTTPPSQVAIDNGHIGDPCTAPATDGGPPVQGTCPTQGLYCFQFFRNDSTRCWQPCSSTTTCPGNSYCYDFGAQYADGGGDLQECMPLGYNDGTYCPQGYAPSLDSPEPNDIALCIPACTSDTDCNGTGGYNFTCVSGVCKCTNSSTDCAPGAQCDTNSGGCYLPCSDNSTCSAQMYGCCLQYNGLDFCDPGAQ